MLILLAKLRLRAQKKRVRPPHDSLRLPQLHIDALQYGPLALFITKHHMALAVFFLMYLRKALCLMSCTALCISRRRKHISWDFAVAEGGGGSRGREGGGFVTTCPTRF